MIFGNRNTHTPLRPLVGFALILLLLLLLRTTDTANNANTAVLVFVTLSPSQWMAPHPPCLRVSINHHCCARLIIFVGRYIVVTYRMTEMFSRCAGTRARVISPSRLARLVHWLAARVVAEDAELRHWLEQWTFWLVESKYEHTSMLGEARASDASSWTSGHEKNLTWSYVSIPSVRKIQRGDSELQPHHTTSGTTEWS